MALINPYRAQVSGATDESAGGLVNPYRQAPAAPVPAAPPQVQRPASGVARRLIGDSAVDLARGVVGVGEAAVGLANLGDPRTYTRLGADNAASRVAGHVADRLIPGGWTPAIRQLSNAGVLKPQEWKESLAERYSPERQLANQKVQEAEGFLGTARTMIQNPSTIAGAALESVPSMIGGGVLARGGAAALKGATNRTLAAIPRSSTGRVLLAGAGEGAVMAGASAEAIRQESEDGQLSAKGGLAAGASGVLGGTLGVGGGRLAQRLGVADPDVLLAGGAGRLASEAIQSPMRRTLSAASGLVRGAATEGVFEELPQSVQETMLQNWALGRPVMEGVPEAAAQGMLAGAAMGGPVGAASRVRRPRALPDGSAVPDPANGPASRVVNQALDNGAIAPTPSPGAAPGSLDPESGELLTIDAGARPGSAGAPAQGTLQHGEAGAPTSQADDSMAAATPPPTLPQQAQSVDTSAATPAETAEVDTRLAPEGAAAAGQLEYSPLDVRGEVGWAERGGQLVRAAPEMDRQNADQLAGAAEMMPGDVVGRTKWVARPAPNGEESAFWRHRPVKWTEDEANTAFGKFERGEALGRREQQFIDYAAETAREYAIEREKSRAQALTDLRADPEWGWAFDESTDQDDARFLRQQHAEIRELTDQVYALGATDAQIVDAVFDAPNEEFTRRKLYNLTGVLRNARAQQATDSRADAGGDGGGQAGAGLAGEDRTDQGSAGPAAEPDGAGSFQLTAQQQPAVAAAAAPAGVAQQGLFAPPSNRELAADAQRQRDDARDGRSGEGRTDMAAGGGELFAGPRPEQSDITTAANEAATAPTNDLPEPTEAQKEAGNYKKGHARIAGLDISIENPAGSSRRPEWSPLQDHYGYIRGTIGKDKDHVDVFMTERAEDTSLPVFVVDQVDQNGRFDEHKVVMGTANEAEARATYLRNYEKGWTGLGSITQMTQDEFKAWVKDPEATKRRASRRKPNIQELSKDDDARVAREREAAEPASEQTTAAAPEAPPNSAPAVLQALGEIGGGGQIEIIIGGLSDAHARAVAAAMGIRFSSKPKAAGIANNLAKRSQVDLREAAEKAFRQRATPEQLQAREDSRPARHAAANARVASREQEAELRRREHRGLLVRENGEPFKNERAARKLLGELPATGEFAAEGFGVYKTEGGWALRRWPTTGAGAVDDGFVDKETARRKRDEARSAYARERGMEIDEFGNFVAAAGQEPQSGSFGPIFTQFHHDAVGAIAHLREQQNGEAVAALHHPEVGDIDLVWGTEGTAAKDYEDGYGIAKIAKKHPDVLDDLQGFVEALPVKSRSKNRIVLSDGEGRAVVRLDWDGDAKKWLMTALKEEPTSDRTRTGAAVKTAEARSRQEVGDDDPTTPPSEAPPPTGASAPEADTGDAGQELWYNRRNRSGAGLEWSDVEGLNDTLKVKEVVKSKVWPRPDYDQLVADGLRPEFAHLVKQVYDTLATKPKVRGVPTDQQLQDYIETVGKVRDAVFDFVRDNGRIGAALNAVISRTAGGPVSLDTLAARDDSMLDAVFPKADGHSSRWRTSGKTNENNARANLVGGNKLVGALQVTAENFTSAIKAVGEGWPAPRAAWQRIYRIRQLSDGWAVSRSGRTVARELPTKAAAEEAAQAHYEQARSTGEGGMAVEARAVEEAQRIGPDHRRPDEDISSERLMETFGFRGVNFGNWMKGKGAAAQRERQLHLNHAYDALLDLADMTGLPPRALSLEGKLGLAFGAQGSGGAAAHFVPGVNEINLTRRTGAGGIAHEWAHALDHYFAVQAGDEIARSADPFLTKTTLAERKAMGVRPEIASAFQKIVNAMEVRRLTEAEVLDREQRVLQRLQDMVGGSLAPLRKLVAAPDQLREGVDAEQVLSEFDALAARLREGDLGEGRVATGRKVKGLRPRTRVDEEVSQTAGQLLGLLRDALGEANSEFLLRYVTDADGRAAAVAYHAQTVAQREGHIPQTGEVRSDYLNEARALESKSAKRGQGKLYWSTPWELFARAFESYIIDRLAGSSRRSDYLSWPQMSESAAKAMKEMGLIEGDRYPRGEERARINEAFDALLAEIRTEETPEGNVRLFSRLDPLADPTRPATPEQAQRVVDRITRGWGEGAPRVVVVADAEGLPARAKRDPGYQTVEGFYDDEAGAVYLVAGNLRGGHDRVNQRRLSAAERVEQVLAHEVVGHFGIEAITGPELWAALGQTLDRMRSNGRHAELFTEIDRRYRGANRAIAVREAVAVMAEKGVRNSVVDRVIAAMRQFLRSLGMNMRFSEAELRQHIVAAARYVRGGARPRAAQAAAETAGAFSRQGLDLDRQVPIVNIVGGVFGDPGRDLKGARNAARDYLKKLRDTGKKLSNDDTGWKIGLSRDSIGELVNFDPGKLGMLLALPRITKVAVLADSRAARQEGESADRGGRPSVRAFHTFYAPVRINDELRIARVVVREDVNGNFAYDFQRSDVLEKANPDPAGIPAIASGARRGTGLDGPAGRRVPGQIRGATPPANRTMTVAQIRDAVNADGRPGWAMSRTPDPFYSALVEAVGRAQGAPKRGDAAAWKGWLDGAQRRGEFKQSERDWMGLDAWLEGRGQTTREELADYVRASQVQVEDVVLGGNVTDGLTDAERSRYDELHERALNTFPRDFTPAEAAEYDALLAKRKVRDDSRYSSYQIPGGENYRELLLTLPVSGGDPLAGKSREELGRLYEAEIGYNPIEDDPSITTEQLREDVRSLGPAATGAGTSVSAEISGGTFQSSHFEQPNILVHVRFNERTDVDGRRVLFLEEIQSDWHQAGRKKGYKEDTDKLRSRQVKLWADADRARDAGDGATADRLSAEADALGDRVRRNLSAVPDAPMRATDEWAMLAFKRMVRWAAEHGFERIAWTTGAQQADRYDMRKQLSTVHVSTMAGGNYRVRAYDHNQNIVVNRAHVTPSELPDVIGKDLGERAIRDGGGEYSGLDLRVGGEGMASFYDKILPSAVNKWAKRMGAKSEKGLVEVDRGSMDARDRFDSVHVLDITHDMATSALAGQPLFSRVDPDATIEAVDTALGSAPLTMDAAVRIKARITDGWGRNAPAVHIVQSAAEFPDGLGRDPDARLAEGVFLGTGRQTVWVNLGAIATERRFAEVLIHEALGHFGVESVVGKAEWRSIEAAISRHVREGTGAPSVRRAIAQVKNRPDAPSMDPATFAKEVIAVMAEHGARNGLLARVVAAVRRWLRQHIPDLAWTDADVVGLIGQADSFLRAGRSQAESRAAVRAVALSRAEDGRQAITEADREAQKRGRRQLRGITPESTAEEIDAAIAAQDRVKARLKDLQPAEKPSATTAPDFEAAQVVGEFWKALTAGEGIFEYGMPAAGVTDLQQIADAVMPAKAPDGKGYTFEDRGQLPGGGRQYGITTPRGRAGALELRQDGTLQLHIGGLEQGEGEGRAIYMAVNTWAARNGYRALPDEAGLTPINSYRRTQMMQSSALRDGGTAHLMPAQTQRLPHWREGDFGKPPTAAEQRFNTGYLFIKGAAQALNTVPLLDRVRFNFQSRRFEDTKGREFTNPDFDALLSQVPAGKVGVGRRTAQRAVLTASALRELAGQPLDRARVAGRRLLDDPAGVGPDLRGEDGSTDRLVAPAAVRGALYSRAPAADTTTEDHGPDPERSFAPTVDFDKLRRERTPLSAKVQGGLNWLKERAWLPMVPLNYLVDYAQKGQMQVHEFMRIRGLMDSYRGEQHAKYDSSQKAWLKLVANDRKGADLMAGVMHDSTLWQVDPSLEESAPLTFRYGGQDYAATPKNVKATVKEIEKQIRGQSREDKSKFYEEINKVEAMGHAEALRPKRHAILRKRFLALSPAAQAMYVEIKDAYKQSIDEWDAVVLENVEQEMALAEARADREFEKRRQDLRDKLTGDELTRALESVARHHAAATSDRAKANASLLQQMRRDFESARMQGPYFPLARFGEYFAAIRNAAGELVRFDMFENSGERDHYVKRVQADPNSAGLAIRTGVTSNRDEVRGAVDAGFMLEIEQTLSEHGATATLKDAVWQRYLATLPGLSQRKHFIHRKGTPGYSSDAMRAYGDHMFHLAHQIAKLRYGPQLRQSMELAREEAANPLQGAALEWAQTPIEKREALLWAAGYLSRDDELGNVSALGRQIASGHFASLPDPVKTRFLDSLTQAQRERARKADALYDSTQADLLLNEMELRLEWILNPQGGSTAQKMTTFAFLWNLAITPAAALVNWTQTPMLGIPILGANLGGATKAAKALAKASKELTQSKRWHLSNSLTGDEKRAFDEFLTRGLLDRTYAQLMAGVGDTGVKYSALREKWMGRAAFLFHNMERINRETTALAAYRMAVEKGMTHSQAVDEAVRLTHLVHFDMTNSARARALQSDAAKVLMIHRSHSLNMTYRMLRDLKQMLRGATQEERRIARQQFMGIMGMHALLAGVAGVPFYGIAMAAAGLLKDAFGDDDDERTPEDMLKKWLYDAMPKEWADIVLYGAPSKVSGFSLYNRIGFPDFFFRDPPGEMEGRTEAEYYINQFLGPAFAIPTQMWTGISHIGKGQVGRGVENLLPKGVRDVIKAGRYASEGVLTFSGDPVVDELSAWEMIGQAMGFSPFTVSEAYEQRKGKKGLEARIKLRRAGAMNRYMLGMRQGDAEMMREAMRDIQAFNRAYAENAITPDSLRRSARARLRRSERAGVAGMVLDQKLEGRLGRELGY